MRVRLLSELRSRRAPKGTWTKLEVVTVMCLSCGEGVEDHPDGRRRRYCSPACRQAAYRARRRSS